MDKLPISPKILLPLVVILLLGVSYLLFAHSGDLEGAKGASAKAKKGGKA